MQEILYIRQKHYEEKTKSMVARFDSILTDNGQKLFNLNQIDVVLHAIQISVKDFTTSWSVDG